MSTRDLGSVTSYAMAVALGFEGTEAEWVTYMMEAGDNAASAAASAASASASATSAEASAETARINYGSPLVASTVSAMTELNRVYVYTGSETGYTTGNWYYFDGTTWVSGGVYNGEGINTDTTLSVSGMAADSKAVGDVVGDLANLDTEDKSNLVAAINEAAQSGGGGGGGTSPAPYTSNPSALGTANPGSSTKYSKGDHVHPMPSAGDVGAIPAPSSPASGAFLVWNGSAWVAQTLSTWQGGSY